jgi:L-seryl-tRNA(Ser) seleniumtransferase
MDLPRPAIVAVIRRELAALRREKEIPDFAGVLARIRSSFRALRSARIQPVINGTGIIVHTNLGRSPMGPAVVETLHAIAANYNNLEYDLTGGERAAARLSRTQPGLFVARKPQPWSIIAPRPALSSAISPGQNRK